MKKILSNSSNCGTDYVVPDLKEVVFKTCGLFCGSTLGAELEMYGELERDRNWENE